MPAMTETIKNETRRKKFPSHPAGRRRSVAILLVSAMMLATVCFVLPACRQKMQSVKSGAKSDTGIHNVFREGPATCTIDTDHSKMTIADRLHLKITVVVAPGYEIKLPPTGEKLSQFGIVDYHTSAPELTGKGKTRIIRTYVLEPFLSGEYTIPSIAIRFWKSGTDKKNAHVLRTKKISMQVASVLPERLKKMKLHDIAPPVGLPRSMALWIWAAIGGGVLVAGAAVFYFMWMRRNAALVSATVYIPPHEQAYRELEQLVADDLIEKGEVKSFYQRISNVLRRYIENRFGIHAPEQTTEEFLDGLKTDTTFPKTYHALLRDFLRHCDLVKFAAHEPSTEDIQNTFDSCKKFIAETKETETEPPDAA